MKIKIKKGLDIPISGKPESFLARLPPSPIIALNLSDFDDQRFKILAKAQDSVKIGTPLVESKVFPGLVFASPAGGQIMEIRRGAKRRLLNIIIQRSEHEESQEQQGLSLSSSKEEILSYFLKGGIFPHIRMRPFNLMATPKHLPRDIFIQAVETLPFVPPAEKQIEGHEESFQIGLDALSKLTDGKVHLIFNEKTTSDAFLNASNVEKHTVAGPHPASSLSLHIHKIAPIKKANDVVWTLSALDVLIVGKFIKEGRYFTDRVISLGGEGFFKSERKLYKGRIGLPIRELANGKLADCPVRLISGDPLVGVQVDLDDFLGFTHTSLSAIPENFQREPFHFFRLGRQKYSATKAYLSGHVRSPEEGYSFTTNQHGEERPFIDTEIYDKVMPLDIPTVHLIKAILSEDFETAETLGLLEVTSEDFALPAFICPSKIEMVHIVKEGLSRWAKESGF